MKGKRISYPEEKHDGDIDSTVFNTCLFVACMVFALSTTETARLAQLTIACLYRMM